MNEIIEELVKQIAALEKRLEYMETVEKNAFSTVTVDGWASVTDYLKIGDSVRYYQSVFDDDVNTVIITFAMADYAACGIDMRINGRIEAGGADNQRGSFYPGTMTTSTGGTIYTSASQGYTLNGGTQSWASGYVSGTTYTMTVTLDTEYDAKSYIFVELNGAATITSITYSKV